MLKSLLRLNPYLRPSAKECLRCKVFEPFRNMKKERILIEMQRKRQEENAFPNLASPGIQNGYKIMLPIDQS